MKKLNVIQRYSPSYLSQEKSKKTFIKPIETQFVKKKCVDKKIYPGYNPEHMKTPHFQSLNSTEPHYFSQAKSEKTFIYGRKAYYYNSKAFKDAVVKRQRALKLAVKYNYIQSILSPLSGIQKHSKLKTLMFLINSSLHGHIRIGYKRMASILGLSKRQTERNIRYLLDHGFINVISERHTYENRLANMYVILDIFSDKALLSQLKNMYYDNKPQKKHVTLISNNKELINYNSISTQNFNVNYVHHRGSTQSIDSILNKCLSSVGRKRKHTENCAGIPKRERISFAAECSNIDCMQTSTGLSNKESKKEKTFIKNDFTGFLDQFKSKFVDD